MLLPVTAPTLAVIPQLVANDGLRTLRAAIGEPERWAIDPKVDGVRGLVIFVDGRIETRNRRGKVRQWLRPSPLEPALRRLVQGLPIVDRGTVLDGELVAERFAGTMAALHGSRRFSRLAAVRRVRRALPCRRRSPRRVLAGAPRTIGAARSRVRAASR